MNMYLAGCGKIGLRLGTQLAASGHQVTGLKRQAINADFPITAIDLSDKSQVGNLTPNADIIIFTVTPSEYSDSGYQQIYDNVLNNMIEFAQRHEKAPLFILVSSTGVYGQQHGEWVDEDSITEPDTFSGKWVLSGEQLIRQQLAHTVSMRFSGIYGESRTRLIEKSRTEKSIQKTPPLWTNRIHEDDCVAALAFVVQQHINNQRLESIYLVSDDMPVTSYDVCAFIRQTLSLPPAEEKTTNLSEKSNKRCDNSRFKKLGFSFKYPDYKIGYSEIIKITGI